MLIMKQFSIALNVLLLLAVGYLYYVHFSSSAPGQAKPQPCPPLHINRYQADM